MTGVKVQRAKKATARTVMTMHGVLFFPCNAHAKSCILNREKYRCTVILRAYKENSRYVELYSLVHQTKFVY